MKENSKPVEKYIPKIVRHPDWNGRISSVLIVEKVLDKNQKKG